MSVSNAQFITDTEEELARILSSKDFKKSDRLSKLLTYIVNFSIKNKGGNINETVIAQDVFSKDESFDPRIDSVVRVTVSRLRSTLKAYYAREDNKHSIEISIPVGSYIPNFKILEEHEVQAENLFSNKFRLIVGAGLLLIGGVFLSIFIQSSSTSLNQQDLTIGVTTEIRQTVSSYPLIVVTPFENETGKRRYDFLEETLQDKLVEDLSRFRIVRPVAESKKIESILSQPVVPYEYAISAVLLDVEPEVDLLVKVVRVETGNVILEERVKKNIETRDYYDSLTKIVNKLSGQATNVISNERLALIERQVSIGNKQLSDLEVFECIQLSTEALRVRDADLYQRAYICLENSLRKYPNDSNVMAKLGALKYVGALSFEPIFKAHSVDPNISAIDGLAMIERALEIDPENASVQHYFAEIQKFSGNNELAIKHAELAYLANPGDPENLALLSRNLAGNAQWKRALSLADEAIERNPHPTSRYYYTAFLYALVEEDIKAMQTVSDRIVELDGFYSEIFTFLVAVAKKDEKIVAELRPQIIHLATRNSDKNDDTDAIVQLVALYGDENINMKVRDLFVKGGVFKE